MNLRIKQLREDRDYTQQFIAKHVGCDQSVYSKYETGDRKLPLELAIELSKFYGVSLDYLVGLSSDPTTYWD